MGIVEWALVGLAIGAIIAVIYSLGYLIMRVFKRRNEK